MAGFIIRKLIPDRENTDDIDVRQRYGTICALCGIAINLLLFFGKLTAGLASGSVAVAADAFNNFGDAGSSIVTLAGFALAARRPDSGHPFGHGRFEYISGMLVSIAVILMGAELFKTGVGKIIRPVEVTSSSLTITVLAISIALKLYMAYFNKKYGEKIDSSAMKATAADSLSDCAATVAVLVCTVTGSVTGLKIDGYAGAGVAVLILLTGLGSLKETINPLLGASPSKELVNKICEIALSRPEIKGVHDLMVHDYGPSRKMVSLHVEVDGGGSVYALHDIVDGIEREIDESLSCDAVIHIDPTEPDGERTAIVKNEVLKILREKIHPDISVHDLRIIHDDTTERLVFDSVVPSGVKGSPRDIKRKIEEAVGEGFPDFGIVTKIDTAY